MSDINDLVLNKDNKSLLITGFSEKEVSTVICDLISQDIKNNECVIVVDTNGYLIEKLEENKNLNIYSPENSQEINTEKIDKVLVAHEQNNLIIDLPVGLIGEINCKRLGKSIFDYIYSKLKSRLEKDQSLEYKVKFYISGLSDIVGESILKMLSEEEVLNINFVISLNSLDDLTEYPKMIVSKSIENKIEL